ncbi:hypothetical protein GUA87_15390 [Sneathiella sp. P13V-1]|uniref:hypothetical protein n=1 Tax=Sneathiella sp. P13V-1 TaxID=2697366 RepID=UPI00187B6AAF|nr:hypothetical protein [Sneathiella sp. P13V-1]MBE7638242.1 hypothetical protein [Sneathiella sp. P13V-1]
MAYTENMTTVYYFDQDKARSVLELPLDDPEAEDIRKEVLNEFILNHQHELRIPGLVSDEVVKEEVQKRGGYPPLEIIRQKQVTSFLDSFDEVGNLPHEVFRGGF